MNVNEFVKNFANQFEETDFAVFSPETKFRELDEWSSLIALSVIVMLDEEYGIQIENKEFKNLETIADIVDYVEKHQEK